MNGCVHLFTDLDAVFGGVAKYLPDDGVCLITADGTGKFPFFKAALEEFKNLTTNRHDSLFKLIESKGLKWKQVESVHCVKVEKACWYEAIRCKAYSTLRKFTKEELEEGIKELEERFKDVNVLEFDYTAIGIIVTKN